MEVGERKTYYEVHNRNLIRTQEHLSRSVDNDRSNLDALNKSQNPKIDSSNSKSTTKSDRIYSGLRGDPRLQQCTKLIINQRNNCTKPIIKNSPKITEQKNEILSRTAADVIGIKKLLKNVFYYIILLLIFNAQLGVDSAALKQSETSVINYNRGLMTNRKFSYNNNNNNNNNVNNNNNNNNNNNHNNNNNNGGVYSSWRRPEKHQKHINKNCKEYDITSRAYSADLIFEGKARSKREFGQYTTFSIQKILKQRKSTLRPKTQIRLHFGGKRGSNYSRSLFNDCLARSIPNSEIDMRWKLKFGTSYFVFADLSGPMNYTAKGDPIVANKRNFKSIRSVIAKDREKPPRVRGLQDQNLKANSELRLTCQIKGTPVPRLNWYKDGVPLIPSSHVNVTYYRKNSTIDIKSLEMEDRGRYECRATSITGKSANMSAYVNVSEIYTDTTTDSDWPFRSVKCQVDSYCLNGGKCEFIERLGEHMCRCKSGYVGARCENKQLSTIGTSYVCGFNVGYSSYYC